MTGRSPVVTHAPGRDNQPEGEDNVSPLPNKEPWYAAEGTLVLKNEQAQQFISLITGDTGYLSTRQAIPLVDIHLSRVHYEIPDVQAGYEGITVKFDYQVEKIEVSLVEAQPTGGPYPDEPIIPQAGDFREPEPTVELRDGGNSCG